MDGWMEEQNSFASPSDPRRTGRKSSLAVKIRIDSFKTNREAQYFLSNKPCSRAVSEYFVKALKKDGFLEHIECFKVFIYWMMRRVLPHILAEEVGWHLDSGHYELFLVKLWILRRQILRARPTFKSWPCSSSSFTRYETEHTAKKVLLSCGERVPFHSACHQDDPCPQEECSPL
jgi:hypothetical protein